MSRDFSAGFASPDFRLDGLNLVAASAGTGKTYNICNLFARILLANGWEVSRILVVTFTETAVAELRDRIRRCLVALARELAEPGTGGGDVADIAPLLPQDGAERARAAMVVDSALLEFDRASVSTIHSFCGRSLRRYAFESGMSFDTDPPASVKKAQLLSDARDWWRTNVLDPGPEKSAAAPYANDPEAAAAFTFEALESVLGEISAHNDVVPADEIGADAEPGLRASDAILRIAFSLLDAWNARRLERKAPDFDDILLAMRDALEDPVRGPALAAALRAEYGAVLIDEFQDTDPVQYGIFRRAFVDGGVPTWFVGDPKQAIYAFRGGDIETYGAAVRGVPASNIWELKVNYRSVPGIVNAVNNLFRDDDGTPGSTFGMPEIPFDGTVEARDGKLVWDEGSDSEPPPGAVRFVELASTSDPNLSETCADEIVATLSAGLRVRDPNAPKGTPGRPLAPGDMAVLFRSGLEEKGVNLAQALKRRGVPAVVISKKVSVCQPRARDPFRLLLAALAAPSDAKRVRAALLTPFFGLSVADVATLAEPGGAIPAERCGFPFLRKRHDPDSPVAMEDFVARFVSYSELWRARGFFSVFVALESDFSIRARVAASPGGERTLADLLHMAELVHEGLAGSGLDPLAALEWFDSRMEADSGDEAGLRLETDAKCVRIYTIHASKGLQYPVVFLPDAYHKVAANNSRGKSLIKVGFFHRHSGGDTPELVAGVSPECIAKGEEEEAREAMRMLYVAVTRAILHCVVFTPVNAVQGGRNITNAFSRLVARAQAIGMPMEAPRAATSFTAPVDDSGKNLREPRYKPLPAPAGRGSFSSLSPALHLPRGGVDAALEARDVDADSDSKDSIGGNFSSMSGQPSEHPIFDFRGGPSLGTCWHEIFEDADFLSPERDLREMVSKKLLAYGFLNVAEEERGKRVSAVLDMVMRTLELPLPTHLPGQVSRLREVTMADRVSEWRFDFSTAAASATTAALREVLRRHWAGEEAGSPHGVFLDTLQRWNKPIPKGFFTGYADLLYRVGDAYFVVDWKSNSLNRREEAFSREGLVAEMASQAYFLQSLFYCAALHGYLRECMPGYSWERNFGGASYIFLRGAALGRECVWHDRPSEALLDDFGAALGLSAEAGLPRGGLQ